MDVNGDGKANGVYYNTADTPRSTSRSRTSAWASMPRSRASSALGIKLTGDFFYTEAGQLRSPDRLPAQFRQLGRRHFLPIDARNTGVQVYNGYNGRRQRRAAERLLHRSERQFYMGDIETYSDDNVTNSTSRNFNLEVAYDQGGRFTGEVRGVYANASQLHMESYLQYASRTARSGRTVRRMRCRLPCRRRRTPTSFRAERGVFNPYGFAPNTTPASLDFGGNHMGIGLPSSISVRSESECLRAQDGDFRR